MRTKSIKLWQLNIIISLIMVVFYNLPFWQNLIKIIHPQVVSEYAFLGSIFTLLTLLINLLLTLFNTKYTYKFILIVVFLGASSALYFINQYNILIDSDMVQNVFETNRAEAFDFVNMTLVYYVILMGILPLFIILKLRIQFEVLSKVVIQKIVLSLGSLVMVALLLYISYPSYASIARNQRHLSHKIIPTNFIFASISYLKQSLKSSHKPFNYIAQDAQREDKWNKEKTVILLIIGETARADHFSTNGYEKQTTPLLQKRLNTEEILNFTQVSSCGTSTATSLPCIFSYLIRKNYSKSIAKNSENVLDFLLKTGFSVQWRDNNTGCKGICDRADFRDLTDVKGNEFCQQGECYDEILLNNLSQQIKQNPNSQIIVLHQKGSHGPAYYLRYPAKFKKFKPTCNSNELQSCSQQHIINAYDNSILYTDYIVDQSIQLLQQLPKSTKTALIYLSDHGESLGENHIYLHGTPYFMAPEAQTHVPLMVWLSTQAQSFLQVDYSCLSNKQNDVLSHDNYFHSILGLLKVKTQYYKKELDIFSQCRDLRFNK